MDFLKMLKWNIAFLVVIYYASFLISSPNSFIMEPINKAKQLEEIGIVFVQGAFLESDRYFQLSNKIQHATKNYKTWISITNAWFDLPLSIIATKAINKCFSELYEKGLSKSSKIYLVGHSLGAIAAFDYYQINRKQKNIAGLITLGSVYERVDREKANDLNILVLGGELDGLMRVTRIAEEFYHRNLDSSKKFLNPLYFHNQELDSLNFIEKVYEEPSKLNATSTYTIVLEGLNHMNFASGAPSQFAASKELKSEVSFEQGHDMISKLINAFISQDLSFLKKELERSYKFFDPIIQAYEYEGSVHFNRPDQTKCKRGYCSIGSEWTKRAQEIIALRDLLGGKKLNFNITNDFVILSSLPPFGELYHPKMTKINSTVNISTFSQCSWSFVDKYFDGGFAPTSANEIGSKMYSRQCTLIYGAGNKKEETPLSVDLDANICSEVNKSALKWAQETISKKSLDRFNQYGQQLSFNNDTVYGNGFLWTYSVLKMSENSTTSHVDVHSYSMITDIDAKPMPIFAPDGLDCYHYCKLLSPARAVEWMYVDGLRKNYHI